MICPFCTFHASERRRREGRENCEEAKLRIVIGKSIRDQLRGRKREREKVRDVDCHSGSSLFFSIAEKEVEPNKKKI